MPPKRRRGIKRKRTQRGGAVDVQKWIAKTGKEFHWPGYQYMGPGTHLAKRLKRGIPAKIAWTGLLSNTTLITAVLRICKINGKPIPR